MRDFPSKVSLAGFVLTGLSIEIVWRQLRMCQSVSTMCEYAGHLLFSAADLCVCRGKIVGDFMMKFVRFSPLT
jgi:hypothetical protein